MKRSGHLWNYAENVIDYIPENMRVMIEEVERIEDLPEEMTDEEICLEAIELGCTLKEVPEQCRTKDVCLEAVKKNGFALEYAPVKTLELCIEAVKQCKHATMFVPEDLKDKL